MKESLAGRWLLRLAQIVWQNNPVSGILVIIGTPYYKWMKAWVSFYSQYFSVPWERWEMELFAVKNTEKSEGAAGVVCNISSLTENSDYWWFSTFYHLIWILGRSQMYDNSLSCKHVATQKLILTLLSQDFSVIILLPIQSVPKLRFEGEKKYWGRAWHSCNVENLLSQAWEKNYELT